MAANNDSSREMQLFLLGYIVVSICEIFTVGAFPLDPVVRKVGQDDLIATIHRLML
jgi:hypothetical protein